MDLSWLVRARWRLVGAWMWPAFAVLAVVDGVVGQALPLSGDSQSFVGSVVLGLILNLVIVAGLSWPAARLLRMRRRDVPVAIARNWAGTAGIVLVTLVLTGIGLAHRSQVDTDHATMRDAAERAAAWIGDHAPSQFRGDADELSTVVIQGDAVYRACAANAAGTRDYCVIVNERRPAAESVVPAGSETNQTLMRGLN